MTVPSHAAAVPLVPHHGWAEDKITQAAGELHVLELEASDGIVLYPAFQLCDGHVVNGLTAVPAQEARTLGVVSSCSMRRVRA